jgi:hypothetical protein
MSGSSRGSTGSTTIVWQPGQTAVAGKFSELIPASVATSEIAAAACLRSFY